jgi:phosphatidylcholine synthase
MPTAIGHQALEDEPRQPPSRGRLIGARLTHTYTALGAVLGLMAMVAAAEHRVFDMFLLLTIACFIDATDGALARGFDVQRTTPRFDGRKLDDIVDYLTYVVVPMFFACQEGIVARRSVWVCGAVLLASAYAFCRRDEPGAKASFTGFPSYWNIVVLYLYVLRVPPEAAALILLLFAALVFTPVVYVSPFLPPILRPVNIVLVVMWLICIGLMFWNFADPDPRVVYVSLVYPFFHGWLSHYAHFRARRSAAVG